MNHQTFQCNMREQRLGRTDSLESTKLASTTYGERMQRVCLSEIQVQ